MLLAPSYPCPWIFWMSRQWWERIAYISFFRVNVVVSLTWERSKKHSCISHHCQQISKQEPVALSLTHHVTHQQWHKIWNPQCLHESYSALYLQYMQNLLVNCRWGVLSKFRSIFQNNLCNLIIIRCKNSNHLKEISLSFLIEGFHHDL